MLEFKNQNNQSIVSFSEVSCPVREVYLSGLRAGEMLVSYNPAYLQADDGLIVGLNTDFRQFYHLDEKQNVLKIYQMDWRIDCEPKTSIELVDTSLSSESFVDVTQTFDLVTAIAFLGVIVMLLVNRKVMFHG